MKNKLITTISLISLMFWGSNLYAQNIPQNQVEVDKVESPQDFFDRLQEEKKVQEKETQKNYNSYIPQTAEGESQESVLDLNEGSFLQKSANPGLSIINQLKENRPNWLKTLLSFLFVSSLMILLAMIFKRFTSGSKSKGLKKLKTHIVQTIPLGMKKQIVVIDFEGTKIAVGISPNQMNFLYAKEEGGVSSPKVDPKVVTESEKISAQPQVKPVVKEESLHQNNPTQTPIEEAQDLSQMIRQKLQMMKPLGGKKTARPFSESKNLRGGQDPILEYSSNRGFSA